MTQAGEIHVSLLQHAGQLHDVTIVSTRPKRSARVLIGKTPEQALFTVPLLFSLCGNAQSYAALLACRAAAGLPTNSEVDPYRNTLVQIEILREHAWRVLLDWPILMGHQADKRTLATLLKFDGQLKQSLFENGNAFHTHSQLIPNDSRRSELVRDLIGQINTAIFAGSLNDFLCLTTETQLKSWLADNGSPAANCLNELYRRNWQAIGRCNAAILPELQLPELHRSLSQTDLTTFSLMPRWQHQSCETTPFSRQQNQPLLQDTTFRYGNGLLARCLATLLEIAVISENLARRLVFTLEASFGDDGIGLASINAARGLLIHRVELRQGLIHDYCIIAPTEWNFHPEGVLAQSIKALSASGADNLKRQATWLIQAIDPCVRFKLTINDE
ncbi:MAG: Ni,Fe-hydrogenase I large subunit [Gammaproteobacteria bacterium]